MRVAILAASMPQQQAVMARRSFFAGYDTGKYYDEMFSSASVARPHYEDVFAALDRYTLAEFEERRRLADLSFLLQGIPSPSYGDGRGTGPLSPFALIPRITPRREGDVLGAGLS